MFGMLIKVNIPFLIILNSLTSGYINVKIVYIKLTNNMFPEKVQLFSDFYENFMIHDAGFNEAPQIVFVGEDVNHIAEMFRIVKKVSTVLQDENMYWTTELKHLEEDLTKTISVFELEKDTKKYKLVTKQLDILKSGENENKKDITGEVKFNPNMIVE